jgi:cell filamentation protein
MAGKYRTVMMEKSGFPFAAPRQIETLMKILEQQFLKKYTPCHFSDLLQLAYALGAVHAELILIHPFREGNGRVARLLADLMATQANMPPLNYSAIGLLENPDGFEQYIKAIHAGLNRDYLPMRDIFATLLSQSV